ncbi:MAG: S9 family peptidase, partial [Luminiphilus sp.]|nr:S9 family peptidase [Luminiphilus sp.]
MENHFTRTAVWKYTLPAIAFFLPWCASAQTEEQQHPLFDAMDVFELEWASDPQIAPDGQSIVYVRRSFEIMTDTGRADLWEVSLNGDFHRPLKTGSGRSTSPRWSPDGSKLAFFSRESGSSQIHVRWMETQQTTVISNLQQSPSDLAWSPDGKWLAFTMEVKKKTKPIAKRRTAPEGARWAKAPVTVTTTRYQYDGRGIVDPAHRHVFVIPAEGGVARQLTEGDFNHFGKLAWTPNSTEIFFSADRSEDWELRSDEADIYAVALANGRLRQISDSPGAERNPVIAPSGKILAFSYEERRPLAFTPNRIALLNLQTKDMTILTDNLDGDANNILWAEDSKSLYFSFDERGMRHIRNITRTKVVTTVASAVGGTTIGRPYISGGFDHKNGVVAFTQGSQHRPSDVAVIKNKRLEVVTALNDDLLDYRTLGEVTEVTYNSTFDGQEIQGWYVTPPNFDPSKKYPLILEIHGGPHLAYGPHFSAELQLMAAAGYVVFYNNYRGSLSYGEDFALLLQYKYSSVEDFADHMSGIDALIERGFVDEDNLFIAGGSAGGIATAYAVGLTDRFNAAVAAKPVINWISKTLTADSMVGQIYHQFPGPPWEHFEHYWKRSPLSLVGNVVTPTLLLTGEEDRRTPMSETEQFYQALRLRGVDSAMVRLPGASHGIASKPSRLITKVDHILAWFERYKG